jgi:hypothetical protein
LAESGAAYSQDDLFGVDSTDIGQEIADAASSAAKRAKANSPGNAVSDDLTKGLTGDWAALAREVNNKGRASTILADLINREIPVWNVNGTIIESPADVHALMIPLRSPYFESMKVMVVDGNQKIVHSQIMTVGTLNETNAHPGEIMGALARLREIHGKKYTSLIISHNHPSGNPQPSRPDLQITENLQRVAEITGWNVIDHIITNGETYYSFRESGGLSSNMNDPEKPYKPRKEDGKRVMLSTEDTRKAPWEAVLPSKLQLLDSPEPISEAARHLRQGDPNHAHIFYMNTKLQMLAVERVEGTALLDKRKFTQILLAARGREGAYAFAVDYPAAFAPLQEKRLSDNINEVSPRIGIRALDAVKQAQNGYESMREAGTLMEDAAQYGKPLQAAPAADPAPNKFTSRITPKQDAEYMVAAEDGDVATQQRLVDEAAKAAGYDVGPVYRSDSDNPTVFDPNKAKAAYDNGPATLFTPKIELAKQYGVPRSFYLKIKNPQEENVGQGYKGGHWSSIRGVVMAGKSNGRDGAIIRDVSDGGSPELVRGDIFAIYSPEQAKSADPVTRDAQGNVIPLSQRFNPASDSILRAAAAPDPAPAGDVFRRSVNTNPELVKEAKELREIFGKNIASGDLASSGTQAQRDFKDAHDAAYEADREVFSNPDAMRDARRMLADDPADIDAKLLDAITAKTFLLQPADHLAINLRNDQLIAEANGDLDKLGEAGARQIAYRKMRGDAGRLLQIGFDRFMTPAERTLAAITEAIFEPTKKISKAIDSRPLSERKAFIRAVADARVKKVEALLATANLDIETVTAKKRKLALENSKIMREVKSLHKLLDQNIIEMVQKGASLADIRRRYNKKVADGAQEMIDTTRQQLAERIRPMVEAGMTMEQIIAQVGSLQAAAAAGGSANPLSPEAIEAEIERIISIGFGIPKSLAAKNKVERLSTPKVKSTEIKSPDDIIDTWVNRSGKKKTKVQISEISKLIRKQVKRNDPKFLQKLARLGVSPAKVKEVGDLIEKRRAEAMNYDWNRPELQKGLEQYVFDATDLAGIKTRVEGIKLLAGAVGEVTKLEGKKREDAEAMIVEIEDILGKYGSGITELLTSKKHIEDYKFDIEDINHVTSIARMISTMDADWIDKLSEFLYSSMLSGLQTAAVNMTAFMPAAWEGTVGRGVEMGINYFVNDPMSAQFGEMKYLANAMGPAMTRAKSNFMASMQTQHPMADRDLLGLQPDIERSMGGKGYRMAGSIAGRKGDIIRLPTRLLLATDDFNMTLFGMAQVGAYAFRIAKMKGFEPGSKEFDKEMRRQVNTKGSEAWTLAFVRVKNSIFANPLPGEMDHATGKKVEVQGLGDIIGFAAGKLNNALTSEQDSDFVKAVQVMLKISFFPFQRVPFNILRKGIRYTPNPVSLFDIGLGLFQNNTQVNEEGKLVYKKNAGERNADLVERMGMQLQGGILMALLIATAAGEGDEDDQDKAFMITGSMPWIPSGRSERQAQYRSALGPYRFSWRRKNGTERFGFNYGRIEPIGTVLGATIDSIKAFKRTLRAGGDASGVAAEIMGSLVSQAQDKTFLRGLGDTVDLLSNAVASPDVKENRKFQQFLAGRIAMVVPNIIKQPIRESDSVYRDKSNGFVEELSYQIFPTGQKEAKISVYGEESKKPGSSISRIIDFSDGGTEKVHPIDTMLLRWRDSGDWSKLPNEDDRKPWFPQDIFKSDYKDTVTGIRTEMDAKQLTEFRTMSGKLAAKVLARTQLNYENPTFLDVEKVRDVISKSRRQTKLALSYKFSRQTK